MDKLLYQKESYEIRGACFKIYKHFRNTHKELIYHNALFNDLIKNNYKVEKNKKIDVYYNDQKVGVYIPDLIINDKIIIELKAKPSITNEDLKQFWYYLKNSDYRLGFLINFGNSSGVEIHRRICDIIKKPRI